MKTLLNPPDKEEILCRPDTIQPTSQRRWGFDVRPQHDLPFERPAVACALRLFFLF